MFAGYPKHLAEAHFGRFAPSGLAAVAGRAMVASAAVLPAMARRIGIAGRALGERDFDDRMIRWFGAISPAERSKMWVGPVSARTVDRMPFNAAADASPLRRVLHFDQTSWLPDNLLERMDAMTMAASIEGRAPFMDVRLAEYASSIPDSWRISGRTTKRIVREALRPRLPEAVLRRPKNGFRMPVAAWFRGPLREQFHDLLLGPNAVSRDYFNRSELVRYSEEHAGGNRDHSKTLWSLFALETFLQEFF
jgi:asparagine synthase (glutamine-hydrolysing)